MHPKRKRRLLGALAIVLAGAGGVSCLLIALKREVNLYYTPSELLKQSLAPTQVVRLGGLVMRRSVQHQAHSLQVVFAVTDFDHQVLVRYTGVLPALFREGQGVVVQGSMIKGVLIAQEVLAKHDENYRPPGLKGNKT